MKRLTTATISACILVFAFLSGAQTLEQNFKFRHVNRSVGVEGHSVNLLPLFQWWITVPQPTNRPTRDGHTHIIFPTNLPPKPLPMWCHITGKVKSEWPSGWIVDAQIEYQPGKKRAQIIFMRRPPRQERQTFLALVGSRDSAATSAERMSNAAEFNEGLSDAYQRQANIMSRVADASSYNDPGLYRGAAANEQSSVNAETQAQSLRARASAARITAQQKAIMLSVFPFQSEYLVDTFAECTIIQEYGCQVYDAGLGFQ